MEARTWVETELLCECGEAIEVFCRTPFLFDVEDGDVTQCACCGRRGRLVLFGVGDTVVMKNEPNKERMAK